MESRSHHADALHERPLDVLTIRAVRWIVVLSCLAVLGFILKTGFDHYAKWIPFGRLSERLKRCSERLQVTRPQGISADIWVHAAIQTDHAWCNVCYSPDYVDVTAMNRFVDGLEHKLNSDPATVTTLYWIWDDLERIEPTGRSGRGYVERFKPAFVESLGPHALSPKVR